jgi:hypothetical protein
MRHSNTIALVPHQRKLQSYLDFVIDQHSLADHLLPKAKQPLDFIPPFGWPGDLGRNLAGAAAARLLRKAPPDLPSGRYSLLVCPECADLGCGTVSTIIERQDDLIVWHSFGFETNYAPDEIDLESFAQVREFAFRADLYSALFRPYLR